VAFSIRNLSNSTIHQRQKHYEDKYRPDVIRRKSERKDEEPIRILFTRVYESRVTNREVGRDLMLALPRRYQLETPKLLFRLSEDGASFVNLWERLFHR
jgi:hypothetical protein